MLYKIKTDIGCRIYIDDVLQGVAEAKELCKIELCKGHYFAKFESLYDSDIYLERVISMEDSDIAEIVEMLPLTANEKLILKPYRNGAGLYGYSELFSGKVIITAKYSYANDFYEHKYAIVKDTLYGVIDAYGNTILPCKYDSIVICSNDYFIIKQNNEYSLLKNNSPVHLPYDGWSNWQRLEVPGQRGVTYDENTIVLNRDNGLLLFSCETGHNHFFENYWGLSGIRHDGTICLYGKFESLIDRQFNYIIRPNYKEVGIFQYGVSIVSIEDNGKKLYGLINRRGEEVAHCIYERIEEFHDGIAVACRKPRPDSFSSCYGYINSQGIEITQFIYEHAFRFSEGYAVVYQHNRFFGCINLNGVEIFSFDSSIRYYDYEFGVFGNGLIRYRRRNGYGSANKYGFISAKGEVICPPDTYECGGTLDVDDDKSLLKGYRKVKRNGLYGLVNSLGKIVLPLQYRYIDSVREELPDTIKCRTSLITITDKEWCGLDSSLSEVFHIKCEDHFRANKYMAAIVSNKKNGLYSWDAGQIADFIYDDIHIYGPIAFLIKNDDVVVMNNKGAILIDSGIYRKREGDLWSNNGIRVYYNGQPGFLLSSNLKFYPAEERYNVCFINEDVGYIYIAEENTYGVIYECYYLDYSGKMIVPKNSELVDITRVNQRLYVK